MRVIAYLFILKIFWYKIQAPNKLVTYVVVFVCKQGQPRFGLRPPPPPKKNLGKNSLEPQINVDIYFSYFGNVQNRLGLQPHLYLNLE